jgi:hypothetical protein
LLSEGCCRKGGGGYYEQHDGNAMPHTLNTYLSHYTPGHLSTGDGIRGYACRCIHTQPPNTRYVQSSLSRMFAGLMSRWMTLSLWR